MPGSRANMTGRAGRNLLVSLPPEPEVAGVETLIEAHPDGLGAYRVIGRAGDSLSPPPPGGSGGQYCIVVDGQVLHREEAFPRLSLFWVDPDDDPLLLTAGPEGGSILVVQFPVRDPAREP
jgi:hypothetical protein